MEVKLLNIPTLEFVDNAIGQCYDKGCYTDIDKRNNRIERVANVSKHSSVLEFADIVFEITASTKVLLEMTRHRHSSYACKSSRYTISRGEVVFESTGDKEVDEILETLRRYVLLMIEKEKSNDTVSLMLPQAYQYRWITKFNYRSLQNFLELRTNKHAHFHIREVAMEMYRLIPEEHKFLFKHCIKD